MAKGWSRSSRNKALTAGQHAPGMIGGPTGFPGAARYQYPANSEEGRAVLAARALRKAGKAPDTLVVQALNFARPQFENKFPKGATASIAGLWEQETGIKLKFVETNPASEYATNIRNASTKNGSFDLVTGAIEDTGDYAEAGLLRPLDDYVRKYRPSWNDPKYGYARWPSHGRAVHAVQRPHVLGRVRQRHAAVRVPLPISSTTPERRRRSRTSTAQPLTVPKTWDEQAKHRRVLQPAEGEYAAVRVGRAQVPVLGHRQLGAPLPLLRRPEHVLLQARRVGERQQRGRRSARPASTCARSSGRSRARSRRTGSRSTRSSERATASRAARSRT